MVVFQLAAWKIRVDQPSMQNRFIVKSQTQTLESPVSMQLSRIKDTAYSPLIFLYLYPQPVTGLMHRSGLLLNTSAPHVLLSHTYFFHYQK